MYKKIDNYRCKTLLTVEICRCDFRHYNDCRKNSLRAACAADNPTKTAYPQVVLAIPTVTFMSYSHCAGTKLSLRLVLKRSATTSPKWNRASFRTLLFNSSGLSHSSPLWRWLEPKSNRLFRASSSSCRGSTVLTDLTVFGPNQFRITVIQICQKLTYTKYEKNKI